MYLALRTATSFFNYRNIQTIYFGILWLEGILYNSNIAVISFTHRYYEQLN